MSIQIPKSLQILREACERDGIAFEIVDDFSGFVARIARSARSFLVGAAGIGVYPLNRASPFAIARDKAFTHFVLRRAGFAVPDGEHFFLNPPVEYVRPAGRERADAQVYAAWLSENFARPLVVKPNAGKGARLVTFVTDKTELDAALDAIAPEDDLALVQSFVDLPEFRLFLVDGEIAFGYRKRRSTIVGDGKSTVAALCEAICGENPAMLRGLLESPFLRTQLAGRALSRDAVLPADVALPVDFVSNISAGGRFDGFVEPSPQLRAWAQRAARAVSLRVTGLDVFSQSSLAEVDDIVITDVNGSPNLGTLYDMGHRDLVFAVWHSILEKTFDAVWPEGF